MNSDARILQQLVGRICGFGIAACTIFFTRAATAQAPPVETAAPAIQNPASPNLPDQAVAGGGELPVDLPARVDLLGDAQLAQAVALLKANFLRPSELADRELLRAQLQGLVERLGAGVQILGENEFRQPPPARSFVAEILDSRILFLRPGEISSSSVAQAVTVLADASAKGVGACALDLRDTGGEDMDAAAQFAGMFAPKGTLLFRMEKPSARQERIFTSNTEPVFSGRVLLLVNGGTSRAAEAAALALKASRDAIVVGSRTSGEPAEYVNYPIGAGLVLRVGVAEAVAPAGERTFRVGLPPDFLVRVAPDLAARLAERAESSGASALVYDIERPRRNEAALVANANPEIDGSTPPGIRGAPTQDLRDPILQKAVDLSIALDFFGVKDTTETQKDNAETPR